MLDTTSSGRVIWITGLSGAGKTTLAKGLTAALKPSQPSVVCLDGDELREVFGVATRDGQHHGRAQRLELAMQYAKLCAVLANQGLTVVIATISMFAEVYRWNRDNLPGYFEVYLKVPISELRDRDPKGIYKDYDQGKLAMVAGLDLDVDEPNEPDMVLEFDPRLGAAHQLDHLLATLKHRK